MALGVWVALAPRGAHHLQLVQNEWDKRRASVLVDARPLMEPAVVAAMFGNATDGTIVAEVLFDEWVGAGARRSS